MSDLSWVKTGKDFKIEKHEIIPLRSRIRDLIYIKKLNAIVVFLESSGTIGILKNDWNKYCNSNI